MIMRLNKFLARSGVASRRKCDILIKSGKVKVNGILETNFSYQVNNNDLVVCNGSPIDDLPKRKVYLVNKLKGYISTSSDPQSRKCVIDLVNSPERLFTIGRLDRDTTGAILVTNDGELANQLMHPKNQIERVYIVTSKIDIHRNQQLKLATGLDLDDRSKVKGTLQRINKRGGLIYWRVILNEGKNHEVKRIFKALGSRVIHLHRHSIAGLEIDAILPGKYQLLKEKDIQKLKKQIPI
jgi:pseudouridine synthase